MKMKKYKNFADVFHKHHDHEKYAFQKLLTNGTNTGYCLADLMWISGIGQRIPSYHFQPMISLLSCNNQTQNIKCWYVVLPDPQNSWKSVLIKTDNLHLFILRSINSNIHTISAYFLNYVCPEEGNQILKIGK